MRAADHGSGKTTVPDSATAIELQEDRVRQPIYLRIQAANAVAQPLGQHWNDAVRQINAVSTASGLPIECAPGPHICTYVRNVDPQSPAALDLFDVNGVVEIARIVRIDGDNKLAA